MQRSVILLVMVASGLCKNMLFSMLDYFSLYGCSVNNLFHYICNVSQSSGSAEPGLHIF